MPMRDYGKVSPQFWIGDTGRRLRGSLEAQVVAAYLVTGPPAHPLGIFYLPIPTVAHDTGLSIGGATKGLRRLIEEGFCLYDEPSSYVYVPEMARIQVAETMKPGDKRHGWAIGELIRTKITSFVAAFVEKYGDQWQLEHGKEFVTLARAIGGASVPHRSQEQEQEKETERASLALPTNDLFGAESAEKNTAPARVAAREPAPDGFEAFWAIYPPRNGRREKKAEARAEWRKLAPDGELRATIARAVRTYALATDKPVDAVRYLKHRRWEDETAVRAPRPARPVSAATAIPDEKPERTPEEKASVGKIVSSIPFMQRHRGTA